MSAALLLRLLLPLPPLASPVERLACESLASLSQRIGSCAENGKAVSSARRCVERIRAEWRQASAELDRRLRSQRSASAQEAKFVHASADFSQTLDGLDRLLSLSRRNAALIAAYPGRMWEGEGVRRPEQSFPCFQENFDELQELVFALDEQILEGKRAREAAAELLGLSRARRVAVGAEGPSRRLSGGKAAGAAGGRPVPGRAASTITGVRGGEQRPGRAAPAAEPGPGG